MPKTPDNNLTRAMQILEHVDPLLQPVQDLGNPIVTGVESGDLRVEISSQDTLSPESVATVERVQLEVGVQIDVIPPRDKQF
jgi:hypothetical protein